MASNKSTYQLEIEIEREIRSKMETDQELFRKEKEQAEEIRDFARKRAVEFMLEHEAAGKGGYATGKWVESIKLRRIKRWLRKTMPNWELYSDDPKANMLEDGTGIDAPGTHSPWGRFTPTPKYDVFAKTAFHYGGTTD